jgi:hypothetical protein
MLTIPCLTTWELKTASELRFGEAPIPEYDEAYDEPDSEVGVSEKEAL